MDQQLKVVVLSLFGMHWIYVWRFYKIWLPGPTLKHHDLKLSILFVSQALAIITCVWYLTDTQNISPNHYLILGLGMRPQPTTQDLYSLENPNCGHHLPSEAL